MQYNIADLLLTLNITEKFMRLLNSDLKAPPHLKPE